MLNRPRKADARAISLTAEGRTAARPEHPLALMDRGRRDHCLRSEGTAARTIPSASGYPSGRGCKRPPGSGTKIAELTRRIEQFAELGRNRRRGRGGIKRPRLITRPVQEKRGHSFFHPVFQSYPSFHPVFLRRREPGVTKRRQDSCSVRPAMLEARRRTPFGVRRRSEELAMPAGRYERKDQGQSSHHQNSAKPPGFFVLRRARCGSCCLVRFAGLKPSARAKPYDRRDDLG